MAESTVFILTNETYADRLESQLAKTMPQARCVILFSFDDLEHASLEMTDKDWLVSFATGVIVPPAVLNVVSNSALNIHPASPEYPGRDPHHFACFFGIDRYGATAHVMTDKVDDGMIVDVEESQVSPGTSAKELMIIAESAGLVLAARLFEKIANNEPFTQLHDDSGVPVTWGKKRTRHHFRQMSSISPAEPRSRFEHRLNAIEHDRFKNGYIDFHGQRFCHEGPTPKTERPDAVWRDFSEDAYRELLQVAKRNHRFSRYTELGDDPHVLWRHDVDISMHRAYALAKIEAENGVTATYFIQMSSAFYNIMELPIRQLVKYILALGHDIGVHFDISAYSPESADLAHIDRLIRNEKSFLESILGCEIGAVSFHNPEYMNMLSVNDHHIGGLVNAYSKYFVENYTYASDSNGYWRHCRIVDVLRQNHKRMQILTHPVWWTRVPSSPRSRVHRAIMGRAQASAEQYDSEMEKSGRDNIEF